MNLGNHSTLKNIQNEQTKYILLKKKKKKKSNYNEKRKRCHKIVYFLSAIVFYFSPARTVCQLPQFKIIRDIFECIQNK